MASSSSQNQQSEPKLADPIDELAKGLALLPVRPCRGKNGTKVELEANYFPLKLPKDLVVHRYSIEIVPPPKPKEPSKRPPKPTAPKTIFPSALKTSASGPESEDGSSAWPVPTGKKAEQVIKLLLDLPDLRQYKGTVFTDFRANLFSKSSLPEKVRSLRVQYRAENIAVARPNALTYTIRLIENGSIDIATLRAKYQGGDLSRFQYDRQELVQALNILFLHYARSSPKCLSVGGRRSFPSQNSIPDGASWDIETGLLRALRGSFSSVRVVDSSILVNVNLCHGAFYNIGRLDTIIVLYRRGDPSGDGLEAFLRGLRVGLTHYRDSSGRQKPANQNVKTIVRLARKDDGRSENDNPPQDYHRPRVVADFAGPGGVTFWWKISSGNGREITVLDYFKEKYNITLNRDWPVINVGSAKDPVYVGAEVCEVMYGQLYKRKLDGKQTKNMTDGAAHPNAKTREFIVTQAFENVGLSSSNQQLGLFHIEAEQKMTRVIGRRLIDPTLLFKGLQKASPRNGTWNMFEKQVREGMALPEKWSFLKLNMNGIPNPKNINQVREAMGRLSIVAKGNGLQFSKFRDEGEIQIRDPEDQSLKDYLESSVKDFGTKLLIVVLPCKHTRLYQAIKRIGDVQAGLQTMCVVSKTFCEGRGSYYGNVALKINLKLGGVNQELHKNTLGGIDENKTMVVGIDVTHPSPGSSGNCPSVAAMVASVDNRLGQWPAVLSLQRATQSTADGQTPGSQLAPRQEIVSDMGTMLDTRLRLWYLNHKVSADEGLLPENILVYRDGVSEGQYKAVIEEEIKAIETCCMNRYKKVRQKKLPRITFIVVAKRHHTRFFPGENMPSDQQGNPRNGTVVDNGVTDDRMWDFFLQSHTPLQGTARPAHYVVLKNEIFTQKEVQANRNQYNNVADIIESVSYNLCWLYGRATRSVSYCTPAYYADRACERARCYLNGYFDRGLSDREPGREARAGDLKLHSNLENTMFYI